MSTSQGQDRRVSFVEIGLTSNLLSTNDDDSLSTDEMNEEILTDGIQLSVRERHILNALKFLDDLNDEDYVTCVEAIERDTLHLQLENDVMQWYLKNNDPTMIIDLNKVMKTIRELEANSPLMPTILEQTASPTTALEQIFSDTGARLNVSARHDILLRHMEEMEMSLREFCKKCYKQKWKHNAAIEESAIRIDEVNEAIRIFAEYMEAAIDPQTGRIPAEKFMWFIDEWMKSARQITEKFRLRNISLKGAYKKAKIEIQKKNDFEGVLHEVDFDRLHIDLKYQLNRIEKYNLYFQDLKLFNGTANLSLARNRRYLQQLTKVMKTLQSGADKAVEDTKKFKKEIVRTEKTYKEARSGWAEVTQLIKTCSGPKDVEYLRVHHKLEQLQKTKKILDRQENLNNIVLDTHKKNMMLLTGSKTFKAKWFEPPSYSAENDLALEYQSLVEIHDKKSTCDLGEFDIYKAIRPSRFSNPRTDGTCSKTITTDFLIARKLPTRLVTKRKSILKKYKQLQIESIK